MRSVLALLVLILASCSRPECIPAASPPGNGSKEYVRLPEWAKANGFQFQSLKRQHAFQLSSSSAVVTFTVDSREAQINGVGVWFSFPVALRDGAACLTRLDLRTVLQPLLSPARIGSGEMIKTICLDPGHGGRDPGNRVGVFQEKKYALLLAQEVAKQLTRSGFKVTLTRSSDTFIELGDRPEFARRRNADLFVSLHFNAAETSRTVVRGAEVYCLTPAGAASTNARGEGAGSGALPGNRNNDKNLLLAFEVQRALTRSLAVEDRGVRHARFVVLKDATMPAILIEAGFMSHPEEGKRIFDVGYRQQIARAIVEGLLSYKHRVERKT